MFQIALNTKQINNQSQTTKTSNWVSRNKCFNTLAPNKASKTKTPTSKAYINEHLNTFLNCKMSWQLKKAITRNYKMTWKVKKSWIKIIRRLLRILGQVKCKLIRWARRRMQLLRGSRSRSMAWSWRIDSWSSSVRSQWWSMLRCKQRWWSMSIIKVLIANTKMQRL